VRGFELLAPRCLLFANADAAFHRPSRTKSHVVVAGDLSPSSLDEVFREVFHADHGVEEQDLQAVILSPYPPSAFVLRLLNESELSSRITYIQGSPFKHRDLERAGMHHAAACFLLTNKFAPEPEEADAQIVLMAMAVKRYAGRQVRQGKASESRIGSTTDLSPTVPDGACASSSKSFVPKTPTTFSTPPKAHPRTCSAVTKSFA